MRACGRGGARGRGRGRGYRGGRSSFQHRDSTNAAATDTRETSRDGTVWIVISPDDAPRGRLSSQNVISEVSGLTLFATQRIRKDSILSAFRLLVDEGMMRHIIQRCTEREARACLGDDSCSVSLEELDASK